MGPADPLLTIRGLDAWRGPGQVLNGVDLEVAEGEAVAVVGRNGVGKATLVESVLGMGPRTSGVVESRGQNLDRMVTSELTRLGMSWSPRVDGCFGR